jgi:hypothetical protein
MMPSKFKLRQKRLRKRERARGREASQPVVTHPSTPGLEVLKIVEKRFDAAFDPLRSGLRVGRNE